MNTIWKKVTLGTALAAATLTALTATPAAAQGWHGDYRRGGDGAGVAVAAGILGLAVGASLADQGPYYGDPEPVGYAPYGGPASCYEGYPGYEGYCYPVADYYRMGWSWHDGGWWNRGGQRFDHPFMGRGGPGGAPHGNFGGGYAGGPGRGYAPGGFGGGHGGGYGGGHEGGGRGPGGGGGGHR